MEKPDLLQGSVGSLKPHLQASTGSLARHTILRDPRARYNVSMGACRLVCSTGYLEGTSAQRASRFPRCCAEFHESNVIGREI